MMSRRSLPFWFQGNRNNKLPQNRCLWENLRCQDGLAIRGFICLNVLTVEMYVLITLMVIVILGVYFLVARCVVSDWFWILEKEELFIKRKACRFPCQVAKKER